MITPHPEDFLAWRDSAITKFFLAALRAYALDRQNQWLNLSWGSAISDEKVLHALRGQADTALHFADVTDVDYLRDIISPPQEPEFNEPPDE